MKLFMYDLAREQSWASDHWRRIVPDLREAGYTDLGLYIEQRYHFRSLPAHRPWGGMTPAQAAEALALCKKSGLRLSWFSNTLGHCDGLLANPAFRYLAENRYELEQLCPSHPDTRPLLKKMLSEFAQLSPSPILHIGGDETRCLNHDERCKKRGLDASELYLNHFQWVIKETKKLGKRPAMWGDMFLNHRQIIDEIDKDVLIFDWHYTTGSAETIEFFQKHGFEVIPSTASDEYAPNFYPFNAIEKGIEPFMREARELKCAGGCLTTWEMTRGAIMENQWERIAAAPAVYDNKPRKDFAKRFFGSDKADQNRLRPLFGEAELLKLSPIFIGREMRIQFLMPESAYQFYHLYGSKELRPVFVNLLKRIAKARPIVRSIRNAATRRKEYLRYLDLPLDIAEAYCDRLRTLSEIRQVVDTLYPHRLAGPSGVKMLKKAVAALSHHIIRCEKLWERFEEFQLLRGGSDNDVWRLQRQIIELKKLLSYVSYHARTYAKGVPVPRHELWYV